MRLSRPRTHSFTSSWVVDASFFESFFAGFFCWADTVVCGFSWAGVNGVRPRNHHNVQQTTIRRAAARMRGHVLFLQ